MKKYIPFPTAFLLFISLILLQSSCDKSKAEPAQPDPPATPTSQGLPIAEKDDIYYKKLATPLVVNSVISFTYAMMDPCIQVVPSNTTIAAPLDTDEDGNPDFIFTLTNRFAHTGTPHECPEGLTIEINTLNNNDSVFIPQDRFSTYGGIRFFAKGDTIKPTFRSSNRADLKRQNNLISKTPDFIVTGERFFGFKYSRNGQMNLGWVKINISGAPEPSNAFTITEFAVNRAHKRNIIAGITP
jgi:hypothetical protein